jgi:hypothetical protein
MTFITIIARKEKVYFIADTLFCDSIPVVYSLNNQKLFFSRKHRIGMCICDHMLLVHKGKDQTDYFVNHVLREFFQWLEDKEEKEISIHSFQETLYAFVDEHYPLYHNYFQFQAPGEYHERDCYYLFAGYENSKPSVCSHFYGKDTVHEETNGIIYISNHQAKFVHRLNELLKQTPDCHSIEELISHEMERILFETIPLACNDVNEEKPYNVGHQLHCIVMDPAQETEEFAYEFSVVSEKENDSTAQENETEDDRNESSGDNNAVMKTQKGNKKVISSRLPKTFDYVQFATLDEEIIYSTEGTTRFIAINQNAAESTQQTTSALLDRLEK